MSRLKKIIKEALTIPPKKSCNCGGDCCSTEVTAPILKESKFIYTSISNELKYHIDNKIPLNENIYRMGSKEHMELYKEARSLYSRNRLDVSEEDKYFLNIKSKLTEGEATGEELKREYDNILSREADLTRIYQNDRTDENWIKLTQFRDKGRFLEKKLAKMGLIDSYLAEINVNEASRPDVPSPSKWWTGDKDALMSYVYWKKGQLPPTSKAQYEKEWEKLANQLQKKYPAPSAIYRKKLNEGKNSNVNFVKRLLQSLDMGMGTKPLSEYQISVIIEALFRHKIIQ